MVKRRKLQNVRRRQWRRYLDGLMGVMPRAAWRWEGPTRIRRRR